MSSLPLVWSLKILLEHHARHKWKEPPKESDNETPKQKHPTTFKTNAQMWVSQPGRYSRMGGGSDEEFTKDDITEMVTNKDNTPVNNENESEGNQINKIPHTKGFNKQK